MSVYSIEERINRGVEILDVKAPGWREKIDLSTFSFNSDHACPLGQVFGYLYTGLERLEIDAEDAWEYGFDLSPMDDEWSSDVHPLWVARLEKELEK